MGFFMNKYIGILLLSMCGLCTLRGDISCGNLVFYTPSRSNLCLLTSTAAGATLGCYLHNRFVHTHGQPDTRSWLKKWGIRAALFAGLVAASNTHYRYYSSGTNIPNFVVLPTLRSALLAALASDFVSN